jgi:hypothetical protein
MKNCDDGISKAIQVFVDKGVNATGVKIDWHWAGGRGIVKTMRENVDDVCTKMRIIFANDNIDGIWQVLFYPVNPAENVKPIDFEQRRREKYAKNINR